MITIEADWLSAFFRLAVIGLELAGTLTILVARARNLSVCAAGEGGRPNRGL
jgi:hypothetical protein